MEVTRGMNSVQYDEMWIKLTTWKNHIAWSSVPMCPDNCYQVFGATGSFLVTVSTAKHAKPSSSVLGKTLLGFRCCTPMAPRHRFWRLFFVFTTDLGFARRDQRIAGSPLARDSLVIVVGPLYSWRKFSRAELLGWFNYWSIKTGWLMDITKSKILALNMINMDDYWNVYDVTPCGQLVYWDGMVSMNISKAAEA